MTPIQLGGEHGCVIRTYTVEDYAAVKAVLEDAGLFEPTWDSEASLESMIAGCPTSILVATINSEIVGCVYVHAYGHWAYLWRLAVHSSQRNQGVATLLLEGAQEVLQLRGVPEVAILVNENNETLKDFYAKRDWQMGGVYRSMWKRVE